MRPTGTLTIATHADASEQEVALRGWEQRYRQMSRGRFEGATASVDFGRVSIGEERLNVEVAQTSSPPPGKLVLILHPRVVARRLNGQAQAAQLFFHRGGNVLDITNASGDSRACYLIVDEALFPDLDFRQVEPISAVKGYGGADELTDWAQSVLASAPTTMRQSPGAMEQVLPGMIADRVWDVCSRMLAAESGKRPRETYAYALFKRARARVMDDPDQVLGVSDLAAYLNVPEHVLRGAFLDATGITPRAWLRIFRLDRARRAILQSDRSSKTVAQVAMEAGFFHLGRFSAYYAQLFHETPFETLRGLVG
ncbi:helix-turn-helix domain-containing protein [Devosia sp. A16]|uniref:helix-turn-helix domain-containing protein n=1 Tax=Devosia sp. A16 TaxID=1736675 RepID=UPI0006D81517|nr:helix-turn-helix domain-containing protein [Devosia sp. A16]